MGILNESMKETSAYKLVLVWKGHHKLLKYVAYYTPNILLKQLVYQERDAVRSQENLVLSATSLVNSTASRSSPVLVVF